MIIEINNTSTDTQLININLKTFLRVRKYEKKMIFTIMMKDELKETSFHFVTKKELSDEYNIVIKKILGLKEDRDF